MNRIKKALGAAEGTGGKTANDGQSFKRYCTIDNKRLSSFATGPGYPFDSDLSQLIGQAQDFIDHCEVEAAYHRSQALRYAANAELHRRILGSLQTLIPSREVSRG